ncbi:PEP-CTERM sorting domain-containing protein [Thalassotalea euphylliae]|uniref:PEP-CTERM sorting domain-containing protein n=1 Tax=Thalassotalea euphylliae TaxID=1655234 RepID=UPI003642FDF4
MKNLVSNTFSAIAFSCALSANAGLIDFELTHNGLVPTDNAEIALNDTFNVDGVAVRFGFDSDYDGVLDTTAVFEEVGNNDTGGDTGYKTKGGPADFAMPGFESQMGRFFLRQSNPYQAFGIFTILYDANNPVTAASGEIWDIDGGKKTEQFQVKAFNGSALLASVMSPLGNDKTLDGKPWTFGFSGLSNITKIEITFTGTKTQGIGLAFNNFSPVMDISQTASIPEPSVLALMLLSVGGLLVTRRAG